LLAWAGTGCAVALAYRGDWVAAGGAAGCILVLVVLRFCKECAATRARMRLSAERQAALDSAVTASRLAAKKAA
jgi:hypothetical protein